MTSLKNKLSEVASKQFKISLQIKNNQMWQIVLSECGLNHKTCLKVGLFVAQKNFEESHKLVHIS